MRHQQLLTSFVCLPLVLAPLSVSADVIVLTNRASTEVRAELAAPDISARSFQLASGAQRIVRTDGRVHLRWRSGRFQGDNELHPFAAYVFGENAERKVELHEIGIGTESAIPDAGEWASRIDPPRQSHTVRVRLCVDDEQPLKPARWQKEYAARLEDASKILDRTLGVKFVAVEFSTWDSEDGEVDFTRSLAELEREVPAKGVDLVLGVTSQYQPVLGRTHLGGGRGPLTPHILTREWSRVVDDGERLELLLHELGHYLGATHSPEATSYMRPVIGRRTTPFRRLTGELDPLNSLIAATFCEEHFERRVRSFDKLSPLTKIRLNLAYQAIQKTLPTDPSAAVLAAYVLPTESDQQAQAAAHVLASVRNAARAQRIGKTTPKDGAAWTSALMRRSAAAAGELPPNLAAHGLVVGVALAMDTDNTLATHPILSRLRPKLVPLETPKVRAKRTSQVGTPTAHGRADLVKHFVVAAALAELLGEEAAWSIALSKEIQDANGGSGFSFADLAADMAGLEFSKRIKDGSLDLATVRDSFDIEAWLLPPQGLQEGLGWEDFQAQFGGLEDSRFLRAADSLRKQVRERFDLKSERRQ